MEIKSFSESPDRIVSQEAIASLLADLEQYDKDHSQGKWIGRIMTTRFASEQPIGESEETADEAADSESDQDIASKPEVGDNSMLDRVMDGIETNFTIEQLEEWHGETLGKIGLELESPNKEGSHDENELYSVGDMRINIADREKLIAFLRSISQPTPVDEKLLGMAARRLYSQIINEYSLDSADDRFLELLSGMDEMATEYDRLGLSAQIVGLKECSKYMNGSFKEYILAKKNGIFQPIGKGFNLSTYHSDNSPEGLEKAWNKEVFETLETIKQNPKAGVLYRDVLDYANAAMEYAEKDAIARIAKKSGESKWIEALYESLKKIKEKLRGY